MSGDKDRTFAGKVYDNAVQRDDANLATADGAADDIEHVTVILSDDETDGVGMIVLPAFFGGCGDGLKMVFYAHFLCQLKGVAQTQIPGIQTENTGQQCLIGTMTFIGLCKGAVQLEHNFFNIVLCKNAGHFSQTGCTRSMGAGGADHDRAGDIKSAVASGQIGCTRTPHPWHRCSNGQMPIQPCIARVRS